MAKDLYIPVTLRGNRLEAKATLGQTVIVTEGPETYTGPVTVTPTESAQTLQTADKMLTDNLTVNPIPSEYIIPTGTETISITENGTVSRDISDKETVTVNVNVVNEDYEDALTAFGVESDLADGISALTEYSNEITGEADETLSDAVRTLCDGYGQGAQNVVTGTFIGNGTTEITISAPFDPDIVIAYSPNKLADYAVNAAWYFFLGPMVAMLPRRTASGYGASANVIDLPASNNKPGKTYVDGALTLLANGSIYQFANGATYNYILVKL